jgi:hypothetical protein
MAVAIAAAIGIPCGIVSAVFRGRWIDQVFTGIAMLGASIPSFWLGLVLIQIFAVSFGWFPVSGYGAPEAPLAERLHALVLPAAVLGLLNSALIIRSRALRARRAGRGLRAHRALKGLWKLSWCSSTLRNAGADRHRHRHDCADDRRRGRHQTVFGLPGWQPGGERGAAARLPVIQGALWCRRDRAHQFRDRPCCAVVDPRVRPRDEASSHAAATAAPAHRCWCGAVLRVAVLDRRALVRIVRPHDTRADRLKGRRRADGHRRLGPATPRTHVHGARLAIAALTALGSVSAGTVLGPHGRFFRKLDAADARGRRDDGFPTCWRSRWSRSSGRRWSTSCWRWCWSRRRVSRRVIAHIDAGGARAAVRRSGAGARRAHLAHPVAHPAEPDVPIWCGIVYLRVCDPGEARLSFGVGVPPDIRPGHDGRGQPAYAHRAFWVVLFPNLAIIFTALSLQCSATACATLEPKLRGALRRGRI